MNMLPPIIAFSGRMRAGKSALADVCINEFGYERVSFGKPLKELIVQLCSLKDIEELNSLKKQPIGVNFDRQLLSQLTEIPLDFCIEKCKSLNEESTGRDLLQVIGTDCIRAYNPNWHVERVLKNLPICGKYVFDDVRFMNEYEELRKLNASMWMIIRPLTNNISNHPSESTMQMSMFGNHVIINDNDIEKLKNDWRKYLEAYPYSDMYRDCLTNKKSYNTDDYLYIYPEIIALESEEQLIQQVLKITIDIKTNEDSNGFILQLGNDKNSVAEMEIVNPVQVELLKAYFPWKK